MSHHLLGSQLLSPGATINIKHVSLGPRQYKDDCYILHLKEDQAPELPPIFRTTYWNLLNLQFKSPSPSQSKFFSCYRCCQYTISSFSESHWHTWKARWLLPRMMGSSTVAELRMIHCTTICHSVGEIGGI